FRPPLYSALLSTPWSLLSLIIVFLFASPLPVSSLFPYTTLFRSSCVCWRRLRLSAAAWLLGCARLWVGVGPVDVLGCCRGWAGVDRKSTRLNSSHVSISYAVFCLKKKNKD